MNAKTIQRTCLNLRLSINSTSLRHTEDAVSTKWGVMSSIDVLNETRYAGCFSVKVKPELIEPFLEKMRSVVLPSIKEQEGVRRCYLLRTARNQNEFVSMTLWNTNSDADRYVTSGAFDRNTASVRDFFETTPTVTEFDVELHDVNADELPLPKSAQLASTVRREKRPATHLKKEKFSKRPRRKLAGRKIRRK